MIRVDENGQVALTFQERNRRGSGKNLLSLKNRVEANGGQERKGHEEGGRDQQGADFASSCRP